MCKLYGFAFNIVSFLCPPPAPLVHHLCCGHYPRSPFRTSSRAVAERALTIESQLNPMQLTSVLELIWCIPGVIVSSGIDRADISIFNDQEWNSSPPPKYCRLFIEQKYLGQNDIYNSSIARECSAVTMSIEQALHSVASSIPLCGHNIFITCYTLWNVQVWWSCCCCPS